MNLNQILNSELEPAGFKKLKSIWYRDKSDTFDMVHLQKSKLGPYAYISVGACLKSKSASKLKYDDMSIVGRLRQVASSDLKAGEKYSNGFTVENLPAEESDDIRKAVKFCLNTFFALTDSFATIQTAKSQGKFVGFLFHKNMIDALKELTK